MKIGTYVCDKDDLKFEDPAIVVHNDDNYPEINMIKRSDGHLSTRDDDELVEIDAVDFMKVWCKDQVGY